VRQLDHHLAVDDAGTIVCRRCGHALGGADRSFKEGAVVREGPIQEANPLIADPRLFIDDEVVFRRFFCPGCATLLETEVILASSPPVWDKQLAVEPDAMGRDSTS
jgi:N-methylhydantoinase B